MRRMAFWQALVWVQASDIFGKNTVLLGGALEGDKVGVLLASGTGQDDNTDTVIKRQLAEQEAGH